jgi:hypothetical protein
LAKVSHVPYRNVTIESIDWAINDWFDKTVDVHAPFPNSDRKKVPVVFASGERWVTAREKKGIRDKNGVLILPVISLRRTGIDPRPEMQALGTEEKRIQIARRIHPDTNEIKNLNKNRPNAFKMKEGAVYEITTIPFPDRSVVRYELQIQAQYIIQMNEILEKIFHQLDIQKSFVAPLDNEGRQPIKEETGHEEIMSQHYAVGFFENTAASRDNYDEFTDQERIIKWSTDITVPATLQLDPEGQQPSIKVEQTAFKVDFGGEKFCFVDDPEELDKIFGKR